MIYDVVYRWGPDRANPRWRWLSIGAVVALVLWLRGSAGFGDSVDNFGKYNQTYGALAAVLLGAEVADATLGESAPQP